MSHERDFEGALAKAGAFVEPLLDRVGYRAARPPYHCPESTLLNGEGALESIGRFDGLDRRPTLYLTASPTAAVLETGYAKEQQGGLFNRMKIWASFAGQTANPKHNV